MTSPERITVVDAHTEGEPLRVITGGYPQPSGETVLERRRYAKAHLDRYRTALMYEPRGHADMYGCLIMPPVSATAHFSVLFLHNEGYSTMCGHGILGVTRVVLEEILGDAAHGVEATARGRVDHALDARHAIRDLAPAASCPDGDVEVRIDTPAGLVTARAAVAAGRVHTIRFRNVASWAAALDAEVDVPGLGRVRYDIGYGGAFYAFVDAEPLGLTLTPPHARQLIDAGMRIKRAVMRAHPLTHPESEDLAFLYGTIFTGPPARAENHSRHVCIFAEGELDRSPTGTGVSARAALLAARGALQVDRGAHDAPTSVSIESILGTTFTVRIVDAAGGDGGAREAGGACPANAVIPEVGGRAYITGHSTLLLDANDPLRDGFLIR